MTPAVLDGVGPRTARLLAEIEAEFPTFRLIPKSESRLSAWIHFFLVAVTFGGQRSYRSRYHTVIGSTLYLAPTWHDMSDVERVVLLRHERVHLRQRRRLGFPLFAFLYLIPFFPLGLAYGRARIEWEAYEETLRATAELLGVEHARSARLKAEIVRRFTGPDYGYMWPFPRTVGRWYDRALRHFEPDPGTIGSPPTRST